MTRVFAEHFKGRCSGNVSIIDFFYLSIAAILLAVFHLSSRPPTETTRVQNHNWRGSGDHILEVQCVCALHLTQGKFSCNLQFTRQRLRPTLQEGMHVDGYCHFFLSTSRSITWLASLAFTRTHHEPTGDKVKKVEECSFLPNVSIEFFFSLQGSHQA